MVDIENLPTERELQNSKKSSLQHINSYLTLLEETNHSDFFKKDFNQIYNQKYQKEKQNILKTQFLNN